MYFGAMILDNSHDKLSIYNKLGLHYNLVADAVYRAREEMGDPFNHRFIPYIIAALIVFEMKRMMGKSADQKYDPEAGGFARVLRDKLSIIRHRISHLNIVNLIELNINREESNIISAYDELASNNGLNQKGDDFHVGATKILHFINPALFLIIDSNAARAFRDSHNINYRNATQPGYSSKKYIQCLQCAQNDIREIGPDEFLALEHGTPMARIYDTLSFVTGSNWL